MSVCVYVHKDIRRQILKDYNMYSDMSKCLALLCSGIIRHIAIMVRIHPELTPSPLPISKISHTLELCKHATRPVCLTIYYVLSIIKWA